MDETGLTAWSVRWTVVPLALVVVVLVGSVLIPARETWRILRLLRETSEVVEPARLMEARLEFGLAMESSALQGYVLSGERSLLIRYRETVAEDRRRLLTLEQLTRKLDREAVRYVTAAQSKIDDWRRLNLDLAAGRLSRDEWAVKVGAQHAAYDAALDEMSRLAAYLADESAARRDLVRTSERVSLVANASLVLVALAAVLTVAALIARERRLTMSLQRRIAEEAALREAAEVLAAAFTVDGVTEQTARSALHVVGARGALIEQVSSEPIGPPTATTVTATVGVGMPAVGTMTAFTGSLTERALQDGEPILVPDLARAERSSAVTATAGARCSAIIVPLGNAGGPVGALFMLSTPAAPFGPDDLVRARTFGHIAALAYEKVRLLDAARASHQALERVMRSRSRLMRGFSHDIKNPLGAANGYAALLADDIFGPLRPEQRESIESIRRSIRSGLALIDDLHELARAETGNLPLSMELVDIGALVRATGDEYRAAASARGLSLAVEVAPDLTSIETDGARVRQIIGNLMSNAIKYTDTGSVRLRARLALLPVVGAAGWLCIDVIDTGPGIPQDKCDTVFEEFSRLATTDKPGTGLGLAISQRVAHALGGDISMESEVAHGSTFTLRLPARSRETGASASAPADVVATPVTEASVAE